MQAAKQEYNTQTIAFQLVYFWNKVNDLLLKREYVIALKMWWLFIHL